MVKLLKDHSMLIRVAVGIHKDDMDAVIKTYNYMSEGWFTRANPKLFNSGTLKTSNVFLFSINKGR